MTTPNPPIDQALRLLRLVARLHRWTVTTVQANQWGQGLSMRQLGVLAAIGNGVSSPGLLARRLLVTPAVITGLVDRLERQGYVRREAEADDRRRQCLVLTKDGRAVSESLQQVLGHGLATQFDPAPSQVKALGEALDQMERALNALETRPLLLAEGEDSDVPDPAATRGSAARARTPRAAARERTGKKLSPKKLSK